MPSAFAVLRLITNSNFVGCKMGGSAGLMPCFGGDWYQKWEDDKTIHTHEGARVGNRLLAGRTGRALRLGSRVAFGCEDGIGDEVDGTCD
jgi:hypothetical protein